MIKNRIFLLLMANVALAMIISFNREEEKSPEERFTESLSNLLAHLDTIRFRGERQGQETYFHKRDREWRMIDPLDWPTDSIALSNLLSKTSHFAPKFLYPIDSLFSRGELLSDYELDANSSVLRLSGNGESMDIHFGKSTRDEKDRFLMIKIGDDKKAIWRGSSELKDLIDGPTVEWTKSNFVDLPLYTIDLIFVSEFEDNALTKETKLHRTDNQWLFSRPFIAQANDEEVAHLLQKLSSEKLVGFSEDKLDENHLSKILEVSLKSLGDEETITFHSNEASEEKFLIVRSNKRNQLFFVNGDFLNELKDLSSKLREKKLFSLAQGKVARIKITKDDRSLTLRKNLEDTWIGLEDNGSHSFSFEADNDVISNFLHQLNRVEAMNFTFFDPTAEILSAEGFDEPRFRLEVEQVDSTRQNLLINRSNADSSFWKTYATEQALICLVDAPWDKLLSTQSMIFKSRNVLPRNYNTERIVFELLDEKIVLHDFARELDGESFDRVNEFRAESFVELSFNDEGVWMEGDWLPWKYRLTFVNSEVFDRMETTFLLTKKTGAGRWLAGSAELGLVFNLPIQVIDELSKKISLKDSEK